MSVRKIYAFLEILFRERSVKKTPPPDVIRVYIVDSRVYPRLRLIFISTKRFSLGKINRSKSTIHHDNPRKLYPIHKSSLLGDMCGGDEQLVYIT